MARENRDREDGENEVGFVFLLISVFFFNAMKKILIETYREISFFFLSVGALVNNLAD